MQRYLRYIFYVIIAVSGAIWQLAGINSGASIYRHINIILLLVLIFWLAFDLRRGLIMAVVLGLIMDLMSFEIFGAYTLALVVTIVLIDFVSARWLSNRSIYSLWALSLLAVLGYNFCLYLIFYLGRPTAEATLFLISGNFWLGLLSELAWVAGIIFILLVLFGTKIPKLRPVFLERN